MNPNIDTKTSVRDQVNNLNASKFFTKLANLLKTNPPQAGDKEIVAKLAKIGIAPGKEFDFNQLDPAIQAALANAPKLGQERIIAHEKQAGELINGWKFSDQTGHYGKDYLQRAFVTYFGLGANLPQDAIYPMANTDNEGNPLSGKNKYVIHFDKGQVPPVKGFWSLTMYNDQLFFVEIPLNRYNLSQRNNLKSNEDGSIDLYIQHDSPGKDKESNWLPAPEGKFSLIFRFYWPEESLINGEWKPPAVQIVKGN